MVKRRVPRLRRLKRIRRGRRMALTRAPRIPINALRVVRTYHAFSWTWGTTTTADFWRYLEFTFGNLPDNAQYAAVFDEYRVGALKYTFRPRYNDIGGDTAGTTGTPMAYAHVVVDPGSTLIPAGIYGATTANQLMENGKIRTYPCHRPFSVYFKPKVRYQTQGSGTAGALKTPGFYRTTETAANHPGFHVYVQQNNFSASAAGNILFDVFITAYLTFRNTR